MHLTNEANERNDENSSPLQNVNANINVADCDFVMEPAIRLELMTPALREKSRGGTVCNVVVSSTENTESATPQ
jgi:hypothetical protein